MLTKRDIDNWLGESGVWNEFTHCEDGDLQTAITNREELEKLIQLAYDAGFEDGRLY